MSYLIAIELPRVEDEYSLSRFTLKPWLLGREEWTSVLKLSTMWRFEELRQEAMNELAQMVIGSVEKVALAREYRVEKWLVDGYTELIKRDTGLSSEEKERLGYETTIRIYEKREYTFRRGLEQPRYHSKLCAPDPRTGWNSCSCATHASRVFDNLEAETRELFREELADVKYDGDVMKEAVVGEGEGAPSTKRGRRRFVSE